MKIENRSKSIIRFKTTVGNITLNPNLNDLTQIQYDTIKKHPMFEPMVKSSVLIVKEEKTKTKTKTETEPTVKSSVLVVKEEKTETETETEDKPFPWGYS